MPPSVEDLEAEAAKGAEGFGYLDRRPWRQPMGLLFLTPGMVRLERFHGL